MTHLTANYHTHTYRCGHAVGKDREYIENAIRSGITTLGFSDHSPMRFKSGHVSGFRVPQELAQDYFDSLCALREEYKNDIRIYIGVEVEYYPASFRDYLAYMAAFPLDYKILGQHFVWDEETGFGSFRPTRDPAALKEYYKNVLAAAETGEFLYIAHPDVLNYCGDVSAYRALTADFLRQIKQIGIPLELNRLGFFDGRHYPRREFWQIAGEMEIPAVIGLDAHSPDVLLDEATVERLLAFTAEHSVKVLPRLRMPDETEQ